MVYLYTNTGYITGSGLQIEGSAAGTICVCAAVNPSNDGSGTITTASVSTISYSTSRFGKPSWVET